MNNKKLVEFGQSIDRNSDSSGIAELKNKNRRLDVSENGKQYILHNDNDSTNAKYHIDGFVIDDENIMKCDYLVVNYAEGKENLLFVELKGVDIIHALDQISNTIDILKPYMSILEDKKYYARIICSKVVTRFQTNTNYLRFRKKIISLNRDKDEKYVKIKVSKLEEYTSRF